ncbi:hypothetical protein [Mesorhizobium sp. KR1-2]|uniref:hypothetical protein n=1 Tax=Mesorhizobium sp. KR1-2 TaxID=3156609 RepID=UPI0032B429FD
MNGVLAIIFRLAVVLLGYIGASLASSAFINILALGALGAEPGDPIATASLVFMIPFMALFMAYFAFFPALLVIFFTEYLGKRDWLTHALGGGGVALVVIGFAFGGADVWREGPGEGFEPYWLSLDDPRMALLLVGAGLIGGIAYWLIAGRSAGNWRQNADLPPSAPAP